MLFTEMFRNSIFLVVAVQGDIERRLIQVPKSIHAHQKSIHEASESALHAWDKNKVVCFSEKFPSQALTGNTPSLHFLLVWLSNHMTDIFINKKL